jgi:acyl-lipid omega-3 desaturase
MHINILRKKIPKKYFTRPWSISIIHFIINIIFLLIFFSIDLSIYVKPIIWFINSLAMFRLFCIGHDCLHDSFSDHIWMNDLIGHIIHSILLIPHYPWKEKHILYHRNPPNSELIKAIKPHSKISPFINFQIFITKLYDPDNYEDKQNINSCLFFIRCKYMVSTLSVFFWIHVLIYNLSLNWTNLVDYFITLQITHAIIYISIYLQNVNFIKDGEINQSDSHLYFATKMKDIDDVFDYFLGNKFGCSIVHHLFQRQIPHYYIGEAAKYLRNNSDEIHHVNRRFFLVEFVRQFYGFL